MSSQGPTTNTGTQSTTSLPPWFEQQWQGILGQGNSLFGNQALTQAGIMPDSQMASWLTNAALQKYFTSPEIPAYDVFGMGQQWNKGAPPATVKAAMPNVPGFDSMKAAQATALQAPYARADAAQLKPGDADPFMNKYIDMALNPTMNRMRQQQNEVNARIGAEAAGAGMFGGSREAVSKMLADRNYRDSLATTAGNMMKSSYDAAQGLASQDVDRSQQTNVLNAQLENAINSLNAQLGTQVSLANAAEQNKLTGLGGQLDLQGAELQTRTELANAAAENQMAQLYQNLLYSGSQADASRFLQAVTQQNDMDYKDLLGAIAGTTVLNQFGKDQQTTAQMPLNWYWDELNKLSSLLRLGISPGGTTTGTTTSTQSKPFDWGSVLTGGLGLASKIGTGGFF